LAKSSVGKLVKPPLTAIQAEIRRGINSIRSLMTPCGRSCRGHLRSYFSCISGRLQLPSQRFQTCSIGERSGDLAGHGKTSYP
ncbi:hypothetical protein TNCV_5123171, partial [Trichonephila clavipes]